MRSIRVGIVVAMLLSFAVGCGSEDGQNSQSTETQPTQARAETQGAVDEVTRTEPPADPSSLSNDELSAYINTPVVGNIGNTVEGQSFELRVLGVRRADEVSVRDSTCDPDLYDSVAAFTGSLILVDYLFTNTSSGPLQDFELAVSLIGMGDPIGETFPAEDSGFLSVSIVGDDLDPQQSITQAAVFDVPPDLDPLLADFSEASLGEATADLPAVNISKENLGELTPGDVVNYAYSLRLQGEAGAGKFHELLASSSQEQVTEEQIASYFETVAETIFVVDEWIVSDVQESGDQATVSTNIRGAEPVTDEFSPTGIRCEPFQVSVENQTMREDGMWKLVLSEETVQAINEPQELPGTTSN